MLLLPLLQYTLQLLFPAPVVAMLDDKQLKIIINILNGHQHYGDDVSCKPRMQYNHDFSNLQGKQILV